MTTTRRDFLASAITVAGAPMAAGVSDAHKAGDDTAHSHDHEHQDVPADVALRVKALESLLVEKGIVDSAALDAMVDVFENKVGPRNGARVVARAWVDKDFKKRLLTNGSAAIAEFGFSGWQGEDIVVLENTPNVHHLVVCTLCSCYPWPLLGLPPVWYKSTAYRSRAVIDPRGMLSELGTLLAEDVELRVWDSTADQRYFVLPERPPGTELFAEEALASLITRDAMIGVANISQPATRAQP
jgi:nitrile hydratase